MQEKTKLDVVNSVFNTVRSVKAAYLETRQYVDNKLLYTATLPEDSYIYHAMLEWLYHPNVRNVKFGVTKTNLNRFHGGGSNQTFNLNGYRLSFRIETPSMESRGTFDSETTEFGRSLQKNLVFTCHSAQGINELEKLFEQLREKKSKEPARTTYQIVTKWGWDNISLNSRDWDSVFLPAGMKEELETDLDTFFANEAFYNKANIPWHRGYLLSGPPGNGKSSLAKAIATKYKLNLAILNLNSIDNDVTLGSRISELQPRSVLLLEDVDIFNRTMEREQNDQGPTLAGLLNALDGVATPHGLIVVMTTNNADKLDPALTRAGRVDKHYVLTITSEQICDIFEYVYGEKIVPREFENMAAVVETFKKNITDKKKAREEIEQVEVDNGISGFSAAGLAAGATWEGACKGLEALSRS